MTRLYYVRKARKARRKEGIRKGEPYYWWKFYRCPPRYSATRPPRSAYATRNPDLGALMDCEDEFNTLSPDDEPEALAADLEALADHVNEIFESCCEKAEAVSQRFPNGCPALEVLEARQDAAYDLDLQLRGAAAKAADAPADDRREYLEAVLAEVTWEYE